MVFTFFGSIRSYFLEHVLHRIFGKKRLFSPTYEYFDLNIDDRNWLRTLRNINAEKFKELINEDNKKRVNMDIINGEWKSWITNY